MKTIFIAIIFLAVTVTTSFAGFFKDQHVDGYDRRNGTHVNEYYRSAPTHNSGPGGLLNDGPGGLRY